MRNIFEVFSNFLKEQKTTACMNMVSLLPISLPNCIGFVKIIIALNYDTFTSMH